MNEVIIDGVNVAECSLYCNGNCLRYMTDKNSIEEVKCNSYCDFGAYARQEQLQRAKAELEQYKKSKQASYEAMQEQWNNAINENRLLRATLKNKNFVAIVEENERLKAENEKLKADKKQLLKDCNNCNFHKYKQALEEIRKYIKDNNLYRGIEIGYIRCDIELLEKIDEVLNNK